MVCLGDIFVRGGMKMLRKFIVELEADTDESLAFIDHDIQQELACATTFFDKVKVTEMTAPEATKEGGCEQAQED